MPAAISINSWTIVVTIPRIIGAIQLPAATTNNTCSIVPLILSFAILCIALTSSAISSRTSARPAPAFIESFIIAIVLFTKIESTFSAKLLRLSSRFSPSSIFLKTFCISLLNGPYSDSEISLNPYSYVPPAFRVSASCFKASGSESSIAFILLSARRYG